MQLTFGMQDVQDVRTGMAKGPKSQSPFDSGTLRHRRLIDDAGHIPEKRAD